MYLSRCRFVVSIFIFKAAIVDIIHKMKFIKNTPVAPKIKNKNVIYGNNIAESLLIPLHNPLADAL